MKKEDVSKLTALLKEADGIMSEMTGKRERLEEIKYGIEGLCEDECDVINEYLGEG